MAEPPPPAAQEAEPPECPVCLTPYSTTSTIPRVIPCGHTTCEGCLLLLPHPFPNTIRCPSCTQLVNFPNHPSSLPKNIDLLHFCQQTKVPKKLILQNVHNFDFCYSGDGVCLISNLWSPEFYRNWVRWVFPNDIVLIEKCDVYGSGKCLKGSLKVASLVELNNEERNDSGRNGDVAHCGDLDEFSSEKEHEKRGIMKECGNDREDSVVLDDRSSNMGANGGMVVRTCPDGDGETSIRSCEKEYYDGKIVKGDKNSSRNYGKSLFAGVLRDNDKVGLVKVSSASEGDKENRLKYECEAKVINFLYAMGNEGRDELRFVLNTSLRLHRMGKVYGFWLNNDDDCVYMVCERFNSCLVQKMQYFEHGSKEMIYHMMVGAEMCEIVYGLHSEGLVVGCLSASSFGFDNFGRAFFDVGNVLITGRRVCRTISDSISNEVGKAGENLRLRDYVLDCGVFVSPELLSKMTGNEGYSEFEVCCGSDVWSLACLLVWLLTGKSFAEEMYNYYSHILFCESVNGKEGWLSLYMGWMKKVTALLDRKLDTECVLLKNMICKCLEFDPMNRPSLNELWRCIRGIVIKSEIYVVESLRPRVAPQESINYCIMLGELCQFGKEKENCTTKSDVHDDVIRSLEHEGNSINDKNIGEGVSKGKVKCIDLKGHVDCITTLTVGGAFLFSASYDKIVNVWSLQDFTHVLSLKGHEHRVMAVVYVDESSLCISGDSGGVICIWDAKVPLATEPIQKLNEEKDWRYSGIHAMAVSGTQYFYTGSGDKTVKAWALQDYTLVTVMSGHKSVVSSLAVNNGVLYSGSWDGTVRLWCISDHSPLAVLGEDTPSNISSVLTLSAEHNFLFVGHENGEVKIWQNDRLLATKKAHKGAIFSVIKKERCLFAGGFDKTISVHEVSGDGVETDISLVGNVPSDSTITSLAYWQGKLFAGQADKVIKVYYSSL
ncbi:hypothetical protein LIER_23428 [Lithospermum erythrorhizon]|uniref:Uncharacterized protein n=1 Tax=Lithospermum erythrorhizon TaxID=34254 RepID=A0AAV3R0J2_LITER